MSSRVDVAQDDLTNLPPCSRPDGKYACQRLGCDAYYVPGSADNVDGCCVHHTEPPSFRDGVKSWPCCQKSSHDFGEFMSIRGCATDRHTCVKTEYASAVKKETVAVSTAAIPLSMEAKARGETDVRAATCARCRAGFYCAEHATPKSPSTSAAVEEKAHTETKRNDDAALSTVTAVDPDAVQTCKRPGCGEKFTERQNADDACRFHAGQPIFHETKKGWSCCGTLVYDFDDFLKLPPCARGRHDANAAPLKFQKHTDKASAS